MSVCVPFRARLHLDWGLLDLKAGKNLLGDDVSDHNALKMLVFEVHLQVDGEQLIKLSLVR